LRAWHVIRNASTNVNNIQFVRKFRQCMLVDYNVGEFKGKWNMMVIEFGLEKHKWVK